MLAMSPSLSKWSLPNLQASGRLPSTAPLNTGNSTVQPKTVISSGNSGKYVSSNAVPSQDEYLDILNQIESVSKANTAKSAELAAEQRDWQSSQNKILMDFNAAEAAKNRDWQKMMSDTAHQREIADLQAAGLNPVLSASGGNGAAVTSGSTASGATSSGAKGDVDTTFAMSLMQFLSNMMGYATSTASAGISAGAVLGSAQLSAQAQQYASNNAFLSSIYGSNMGYSSAKYNVDQTFERQKQQQSFDKFIKTYFPSNMYGAVGSVYDIVKRNAANSFGSGTGFGGSRK